MCFLCVHTRQCFLVFYFLGRSAWGGCGGLDCFFGWLGFFVGVLGGVVCLFGGDCGGAFCLLCWMLHGFDWGNKVKLDCVRTCHGLRTSLIISSSISLNVCLMLIFLSLYNFFFCFKLTIQVLVLFSLCKPQFMSGCLRGKPHLYLCAVWVQTTEVRDPMAASSSSGALKLHPFPALQNPVLSKSWTEMARLVQWRAPNPLLHSASQRLGILEPIH